MNRSALLALEDGSTFRGRAIGVDGESSGEVVFNTSMTGYQEVLTDPSYARQIVTLTCPHIGNVGVNDEDMESSRVHVSGLVVRDVPSRPSNWRATSTLESFLERHGIIGISDIDTRRLTRVLRETGAQSGAIVSGTSIASDHAVSIARSFPGLAGMDLAREVSTSHRYQWAEGVWRLDPDETGGVMPAMSYRVVAYDFGIKRNILRMLIARGCRVTVVPATTPAAEVLADEPDGVFLSNGPGDPEPCTYAIAAIRELIDANLPVFGICLGHQLLGLAAGGRTVKMKFGHHGANHPIKDLQSGAVLISSQNHGFAVDADSLPSDVEPTHVSLFDGSLQGLRFTRRPVFGFQGHPEASPGPHDLHGLFDRFMQMMDEQRLVSGFARRAIRRS